MNHDVSVVLFDCDGVMCPPYMFGKHLAEEHGINFEMTKEFFTVAFAPALLGKEDVTEILPPFLTQWGWSHGVAEFLALWLESERVADPRMVRIVEDTKKMGFRVGLATNQEQNRASYMRTQMGFGELFDDLFISCEIGVMKPTPEYFLTVTQRLKVQPETILFIDDQQHYIDAALFAGWNAIRFTSVEDLRANLESRFAR